MPEPRLSKPHRIVQCYRVWFSNGHYMLKKLIKNKKFWSAIVLAAALSGAAVKPEYAGVAVEMATAIIEASEPATPEQK